jgi:ribonuclease III
LDAAAIYLFPFDMAIFNEPVDVSRVRRNENMETIEKQFRDLLGDSYVEEEFELAMTPKSSGEKNNNERLEFLGNAVLNMCLAEALYDIYPDFPPGKLSVMCNYLRSNPVLVIVGEEGGLRTSLAKLPFNKDGKITDKMVSTAFEAIVATLYKNGGYESAAQFVNAFLLTDYLIADSINGKGAITELKELVDRERIEIKQNPRSETTEGGKQRFFHTTTIMGKSVTGTGNTKKMAETKAAALALALYRLMNAR